MEKEDLTELIGEGRGGEEEVWREAGVKRNPRKRKDVR